jgi:hypothetical protein
MYYFVPNQKTESYDEPPNPEGSLKDKIGISYRDGLRS